MIIGLPVGDVVTGTTMTPDDIVGIAVASAMGATTGTFVGMTVGATVSPASMNKSSSSP
jgi:hypothetical protein